VAFAAPSLFTRYDRFPRMRHALVVGISQSGQSPDVVQVITEGRRQGAPTLAITNDTGSPLAQAAEWTVDIQAGRELAVAATKTYTAELIAIAALSAVLAGADPLELEALAAIPEAVELALGLEAEVAGVAKRHAAMDQCVVLGRGYNYATAQEWALKLKELAYVFTDVYSTADFQHGPIAVVRPGFPVLAVAPSGAVLEDEITLLQRLRDEYGAELLVISDNQEALALAQGSGAALRLPAGIPEWLSPIVSIIPAQLYSYHLALHKGYDTEHPRTLTKVTRTR
jgi:glucosamine--fructose-6-phosphate aminotransferase (isomerizing)